MQRKSCPRWLTAPVFLAALLSTSTVMAADIRVMISAGLYEAYSELAPVFEQETGHHLITVRGPSLGDSPEAIPNRLQNGEPADALIMIGASVDNLISRGLVREDSKVNLARSEIGMVVHAGAAKPDISSVEAFTRTLIEAESLAWSDSASGIYLSTRLFPRLGIAGQLSGKGRSVRGPPSGEPVAAVVARGEAEIGFQQVSELIHETGVTFVGTIPSELQPDTFYSGAIPVSAAQPESAGELIRFLASDRAAAAISNAGLTPLSE